MKDKRIRGFLVERKSNKCNTVNNYTKFQHNFNCQGTLDAYYYKGTDTLAELISCSNEGCSRYNKIEYLNDGMKEAGEKK